MAEDPLAQQRQIANMFCTQYYQTFDTNREHLTALYQPQSILTFEGKTFQGTEAIMGHLKPLPFTNVAREIVSMDVQPTLNNGILIFVSGKMSIDNAPVMPFSQVFHLLPTADGSSYWLFNDMFRLVIG